MNGKRLVSVIAVALSSACCIGGEKIDYDRLYEAIAMVESDDGATSGNVYQITRVYWNDVNRIMHWRWGESSYADMVSIRLIAREYMDAFWRHYGERYRRRTGKPVTAEVLAKMHRVGYEGLFSRKKTAEKYWRRVKRFYYNNSKGDGR